MSWGGGLSVTLQRVLSQRLWIVVFVAGILLGWMTLRSLPPDQRAVADQWDLLFGVLDTPFVVMVLLAPLFYLLVTPIGTRELEEWGPLALVRAKTRLRWWGVKLGGIVVSGIVYEILLFGALWLVSLMTVRLERGWGPLATLPHSATGLIAAGGLSAGGACAQLIVLLLVGLIASGTLAVALAMLFRNATVAWGILSVLSLLSYAAWNLAPWLDPWSLGGQLLLLAHAPYGRGIPTHFTLAWSMGVDLVLWVGAAVAGGRRVSTMPI